jgi:SAM-dependent methyltransferase
MGINRHDLHDYQQARMAHWNKVHEGKLGIRSLGGGYHRRLEEIYQFLVSPGQRVLEIGCGEGDLLAAVKPSYGVGVDFSSFALKRAHDKYPDLYFIYCAAHEIELAEEFDVIILSDILNDLYDVQEILIRIQKFCTPKTRLIINSYSRIWQPVLSAASGLRLAKPNLQQNWLTVPDVSNLLHLTGYEVLRTWPEVLLPISLWGLNFLTNKFLVRFWPFYHFALTNFIVARPVSIPESREEHSVSVIVPARNEAGNIVNIFQRIPKMGKLTEIIFVEGHSSDDTYNTIQKYMGQIPNRTTLLLQQAGKGKGDAVRLGFEKASGDILMILDADLTVPPEYLPRFYDALVSGKGELINGVRLVYPMEKEAMRFLNLLGNKFFSLVFSWLLGQQIKDTLCGTKVLWKKDYHTLAANRDYFGDFDPFGDFDLLFGAARMNKKIIDLPIRYHERVYGDTNIQRWKHGVLLLRMALFAAFRLKFV